MELEGLFLPRYRAIDITSADGDSPRPILAECWGRPFRIYGRNKCPRLGKVTELTLVINDRNPCTIVLD